MQQRPVVVVRLSLYRSFFRSFLAILSLLVLSMGGAVSAYAQSGTSEIPYTNPDASEKNYLGRIGYNNPEQLAEALMRVEGLYLYDTGQQLSNPVSIVVHGPEVSIFQRQNYESNKNIVDLAARLSALGVLDINVCETRLNSFGANKESVYPFVGTVLFGPSEVNRLLDEENYVYF